ncbi:hypothetical protein Q5752_002159 [Cryptotrichosporon argae]
MSQAILRRSLASSAAAPSSSSASPSTITASLLLSRAPLLTPTPSALEAAYYAHSSRVRAALSNPPPLSFYFKPGSLPLRRFQLLEHARDVGAFGRALAGAAPDVGDVQAEAEHAEVARGHWEAADAARGDASLERRPEHEVFCLVRRDGRWAFPATNVRDGEALDEAVRRRITGHEEGELNGDRLDTWLVTRKPVGVLKQAQSTNFFLRAHVLAGEITPLASAKIESWAWLTANEVEERLKAQGDEAIWQGVKGMFGVGEADAQ